MRPALVKALFAGTIFTSAFLLFLVQPLIAKQILPWFGGSAAVWSICMVFFQVVLLAGYAYSDWVTRRLGARSQARLHVALLLCSLAFLPIVTSARWKPTGAEDPTVWILGLLVGTIGLPYFLLSTTGPLVQSWVARTPWGAQVYRYFSLSNLASLASLLSYPILIEPHAALLQQAWGWSAGYGAFVLLCAGTTLYVSRNWPSQPVSEMPKGWDPAGAGPPQGGRASPAGGGELHGAKRSEKPGGGSPSAGPPQGGRASPAGGGELHGAKRSEKPGGRHYFFWLFLPALGSWLLLAVTNHITQNVAAIPFLWVLPLSVYLFTFVLTFESDRWYRRGVLLPAAAAMLALCAYALQDSLGSDLRTALPIYIVGLFALCMCLHGEMARMRPAAAYLTRFYLMLSLGGAIGGVSVGLVAPLLLPAYYELGMGLVLCALAAALLWRRRRAGMAASLALAGFCAWFLVLQVQSDVAGARRMQRNFYGTLLTLDSHGQDARRTMFHGSVKHGEQYLDDARRREPTTYYGPTSGIGRAIAAAPARARRIGLIGLGTGTLAAYGRTGDVYRVYEINPLVFQLADNEFTFLADSAARIERVLGDARLALEGEGPQAFDVLAVDAFSGDSVPIHLITTEAMDVYLRHMAPGGVIAFHVTNRFLKLAPVVEQIARARGLQAALVHDEAEHSDLRRTDWVLVARDAPALLRDPIRGATSAPEPITGLRPWTDDFNNLLGVLK